MVVSAVYVVACCAGGTSSDGTSLGFIFQNEKGNRSVLNVEKKKRGRVRVKNKWRQNQLHASTVVLVVMSKYRGS
jgi:hypothetical protein